MKKTKVILLLALVLLFALVGGVYAYWTDQVTVEGTVATGYMRVEWEKFFIRDGPSGHHSPKYVPEYVDADAYISSDPQIAVLEIEGLYPVEYGPAWNGVGAPEGERVAVTGHVENMGTIPVKFDNAELTLLINENNVADWMCADVRIAKRIDGIWTVVHHQAAVPLKDLPSVFNHANVSGKVLGIGDLLGFGEETLYLYLDENAPDSTKNSKLVFTFKLNFTQFNAP